MRLMTWNINSVRLRIETVARVAKEFSPDVICLQETKTPDEFFPLDAIKEMGFEHTVFAGMKGYNGVAILSKFPVDNFKIHARCGKSDCRHITADVHVTGLDSAVELHNLYIPAGGDKPDVENNEKFQHKLNFVDELTEWFPSNSNADKPVIAVGDFNIAPMENDVWSHKQMLKIISHTPIEVEKLTDFFKSMKWVDAMRRFVPEDEKLYSWWSYRAKDWKKADRGRRLDHIWVTEPLEKHLKGLEVLKDVRGWERPSDHAPVIIDFDFSK